MGGSTNRKFARRVDCRNELRSFCAVACFISLNTGGAKGIGLATAQAFTRQGARVALLDMVAAALVQAAIAFLGSLGLLRLKSYFERVHAPAIIATMACWCVMHATLLYFSMVGEGLAVHALLIALFVAVTVPVTNIFLMRAALFRARRMGEAVPANLSRTATEDAREP